MLNPIYTTPRRAALLTPLPRAAARLIPTQLKRNPANLSTQRIKSSKLTLRRSAAYLKKAIREIDRSSWGVRDDENIERRTAGVTGMCELDVGCCSRVVSSDFGTIVDDPDVVDEGILTITRVCTDSTVDSK